MLSSYLLLHGWILDEKYQRLFLWKGMMRRQKRVRKIYYISTRLSCKGKLMTELFIYNKRNLISLTEWGVSKNGWSLVGLIVFVLILSSCASIRSPSNMEPCLIWDDQVYRYNEYIVQTFGVERKVIPRPTNSDRHHDCAEPWNRDRIIEGEYAISNLATAFVRGDICKNEPVLVFQTGTFQPMTQVTSQYISGTRMTWPPYDFYVKWENDPARLGYLNSVETALVEFSAIRNKQCGDLPEKVHVLARGWSPLKRRPDGRHVYEIFYKGTFLPNMPEITLVHNNKEEAEAYKKYAAAWDKKHAAEKKHKRRIREMTPGVIMMLMFGMHSSSPCNDPTADSKPWYCE